MADLDLEQLKAKHDKGYTANQGTRESAADDTLFYWVTQWDDSLLDDSQLAYKGEFNIIRKAGRQIISDLRENPVQLDFKPTAESRDEDADLLDGLYLSDDRRNTSLESYDNAKSEAVVCGVGDWELYTKYQTNKIGDKHQVIRRRPIYEANNNSFPDPNAKLLDKSDAKYWSVLEPFTKEGYQEIYKELTGKDTNAAPANFASPEQSYVFPWIADHNELYYLVRFYHKTKIKDNVLTMTDPNGKIIRLLESDLVDVMDEMIDEGYVIDEEETKAIKRWEVKRYIASGEEILKIEVVAGENIPVIRTYGERAFVEGGEHWEGVTRLAKDPQRLRNFQLSYLADIVSSSPRPKPFFNPEQIAKYEFMFEENGADNNYPYYLLNAKDSQGNPLPQAPLGYMQPTEVPNALAASIAESRQAVEDVAPGGAPKDMADIDLSGKAVAALEARLDQQSLVYQQNFKHALRYDGQVYAGMASVIYDAPRTVTLTLRDGTTKSAEVMEEIMDEDTGELITLNDLTNIEFEVWADIGVSYSSQKEKTIDRLSQMAAAVAQSDPAMQKLLLLKIITLTDVEDTGDIREYAKKQLMLMGVIEPETDEEIAFMEEQSQQQEQPDANTIFAMAEDKKAQAAIAKEERLAIDDQNKDEHNDAIVQINAFKAETDRMKVQIAAEEAGATISLNQAKTKGQEINNVISFTEPYRARASA